MRKSMKKYNSPEILFAEVFKEDVMSTSYGERFGVVLDWNDDAKENV